MKTHEILPYLLDCQPHSLDELRKAAVAITDPALAVRTYLRGLRRHRTHTPTSQEHKIFYGMERLFKRLLWQMKTDGLIEVTDGAVRLRQEALDKLVTSKQKVGMLMRSIRRLIESGSVMVSIKRIVE